MCSCMITVNWISRSEAALSSSDLLMQRSRMSLLVTTEERNSDGLDVHGVIVELSSVKCDNLQWTGNTASHLMLQKPGLAVVDH